MGLPNCEEVLPACLFADSVFLTEPGNDLAASADGWIQLHCARRGVPTNTAQAVEVVSFNIY